MIVSFIPEGSYPIDTTYGKYLIAKERLVVKTEEFPTNYKKTGHTIFRGLVISRIDYGKVYGFSIEDIKDIKFHKDLEAFE